MSTSMSQIVSGQRMRELREKRGWTQEQLAKIAGYSLRTIQRAEAGASIGRNTITDIAKALDVGPEDLFDDQRPDVEQGDGASTLPQVDLLRRYTSGRELLELVGGSMAFLPSNADPENEEEVDLIGGLMQDLQDWGDLWSDIEQNHRVRAGFDMTERLRELETAGFWLFALRKDYGVRAGGVADPIVMPTAIVIIVRKNDPRIASPEAGDDAWLPAVLEPSRRLAF